MFSEFNLYSAPPTTLLAYSAIALVAVALIALVTGRAADALERWILPMKLERKEDDDAP